MNVGYHVIASEAKQSSERICIASACAQERFGGRLPGEARPSSEDGSSLALPCANASRLSQAMTSEGSVSVLAATHRRHRHLIAPAASAIDLVAGAELQILSQT